MTTRYFDIAQRISLGVLALLLLLYSQVGFGENTSKSSILRQYGNLPLRFEPQRDSAGYLARGEGFVVSLAKNETGFLVGTPSGVRELILRFRGTNRDTSLTPIQPLSSYSNYLIGNDPSQWRTRVPNYAGVRYGSLYDGVDLVYYGNRRNLEYDLRVAPGADPAAIGFELEGQRSATISAGGSLVLQLDGASLVFHAPVTYQESGASRTPVSSRFVLRNGREVAFAVGPYDRSRTLIIDPVLEYSTFLGGGSEEGAYGIAVDASGNAYITGFTKSTDFPVTPGAMRDPHPGFTDVFVTKLNASGSGLIYSTYFGGSGESRGQAIAIDRNGSAYVGGFTSSTNFPTTAHAAERTYAGPGSVGFVSKLNAGGTAFLYSTYVGAKSQSAAVNALALDSVHNVYITGSAWAGFPVTANALQKTAPGRGDAFVSKLNSSGSAYAYSTYLGGGYSDVGNGIVVDSSGYAYVTGSTGCSKFPSTAGTYHRYCSSSGRDSFVVKMNQTGSKLVYGTFLGTAGGFANGIAIDGSHNVYVVGDLSGTLTPTSGAVQKTKPGSEDGFAIKLNASASKALYATYLGGSDLDYAFAVRVDSAGHAYIDGDTMSTDFRTTSNAFQPALLGGAGSRNGFLLRLNAAGSALDYSTYFGNAFDSLPALAIDAGGNAFVTGQSASSAFPTTAGAYQRTMHGISDAVVAKFALGK